MSPLLANIYLTAIDERYGRWTPRPGESSLGAADRRRKDRNKERPTFYVARYADDFVVMVEGTREEAENERQSLAEFLKQELRMELSMEKTAVTDVQEGFDFLGYRVVQEKARHTGAHVGKLFIPKSKLNDLRYKVKGLVRRTPTGETLANLIGELNPIITGWRNYYRYATGASGTFHSLDWWMRQRVGRWLRNKHGHASWKSMRRRFTSQRGKRRVWADGPKQLRFFLEGGTTRFPCRGVRIPNGWNAAPDQWFQRGADQFWPAFNTLKLL